VHLEAIERRAILNWKRVRRSNQDRTFDKTLFVGVLIMAKKLIQKMIQMIEFGKRNCQKSIVINIDKGISRQLER
jgi:hypothetical protein